MSDYNLYDEIISDLKRDFPNIKSIEREDKTLTIKADDETLWEVFEVLFSGMDNVELNMGKDEENYITITV